MALARTNRHQQTSGAAHGTGAFTTSNFTPSNSTLLVVRVSAQSAANDALQGSDLTISGGGLTWTSRAVSTTHPGGWGYGCRVFTAPVTTGASMNVQVDAGAFDVYGYRVEVYEYAGHDTGSPVGATAVGSDADGDGAASITLSGAPATTSEVLAFADVIMSTSGTPPVVTVGAGWTELFDVGINDYAEFQSQARTGSTSTTVGWDDVAGTGGLTSGATLVALEIKQAAGGGAATLSSPSPSGTLGTSTSATVAATTDQSSGTLYAVVSTSNNVSTATAAQVKAGQNSTGAAASFSANSSVSTTSPSVGISGLSPGTLYYYAEVQNNGGGDSNVVSGSFTTAATIALSCTGSATATASAATLRTPALQVTLQDIDTGAVKNAVTYADVHIFAASNRAAVLASLAAKTTTSGGVLTLRAAGLSIGTTYDVTGFNSDGSDRFHASAVATDV